MSNQKVDFKVGTEFNSFVEFEARKLLYERQELANFVVSSSELLKLSDDITQDDINGFRYHKVRFECKKSGVVRQKVSNEDRKRRTSSYKDDCESFFRILFKKRNGVAKLRITKLAETHNHIRSEQLYKAMPKQRRHTIDEYADYLKKVVDVRPSTQLIQSQISSAQGVVKRRDIYNFRAKKHNVGGGEFELDLILKEMQRVQGASVKIFHENNELHSIYFQDAHMKSYYANYPDLLMFDGTYSLNDRRMVLIILLVIDGNAESQIAGLFLA